MVSAIETVADTVAEPAFAVRCGSEQQRRAREPELRGRHVATPRRLPRRFADDRETAGRARERS
jgi:hypothetical protein